MIVKAWLAKWFSGSTVTTKHLTASHKMPHLLAKFKWKCQDSIKCPEWGGHAGTEDRLDPTHRSLQPRHLNTLFTPLSAPQVTNTQVKTYFFLPKEVTLALSFKQKGARFSEESWCLQFLLSLLENAFRFSSSDCLEKKKNKLQEYELVVTHQCLYGPPIGT